MTLTAKDGVAEQATEVNPRQMIVCRIRRALGSKADL